MGQSREHLDVEEGYKKSSNKGTLKLFILLCVALTVSTITLGVLYGQEKSSSTSSSSSSTSDLCEDVGCIKAANRILGSMDLTADPCDDFYQYSCGSWVEDHIIGESQSSTSVFNDVRDDVSKSLKTVLEKASPSGEAESITKAKKFYASCLNTDEINSLGVQPVRELINLMGKWPVLDGVNTNTKPIEEKIAEFNTVYGTGAIIYPYVGADSKSSNDYIFQITEPSLGLPSRDYYFPPTSDTTVPAYKEYIVNFLNVMNEEESLGVPEATFTDFANKVVEFETAIVNYMLSDTDSHDEADLYKKLSLDDLKTEVNDKFDWQTYVTKAMEIADDPKTIDGSTEIVMYASKYGGSFTQLFETYDDDFIQSYLVWRIMKGRHSYMPEILRDARQPYNKAVSGTTAESARWQTCSDQSESFFPMPVGSLFVSAYFPPEYKTITEQMVEQIREAFKRNLNDIDWMDDATKEQARIKADAIVKMIAYPDYIVDNQSIMDASYDTVEIDSTKFFINAQAMNELAARWSFGKFPGKVNREEWISGPAIVNAFYSPSRNQIFFPAGILQPPFYDRYQPTAMNYGGIGMVIGHEITHGFDDNGANYDGDGNLKNWWSTESKDGFDRDAKCMIDQYSAEYWDEAGDNLDGELTLGENIADNGGIRESFLAFREWQKADNTDVKLPGFSSFTEEQLFFLGFAQVWCGKYTNARAVQLLKTDPHSPGKFRVKIPGLNYEEFGKAYNCAKGTSTMYPNEDKTCRVW